MSLRPLPNVSSFEVKIQPSIEPYIDVESYTISGHDKSRFFEAIFALGHKRETGKIADRFQLEPNVLYIGDVGATTGHGLGSLATSLAIEEALKRDIHIGRMGIVEPRMVGVVENLVKLGVINRAHYRLGDDVLKEEPLTKDFENLPDLVDAATAADWINQDQLTYADCVVIF